MVHYVKITVCTYTCTVVILCVVHVMKRTFSMDFSIQIFKIKFAFMDLLLLLTLHWENVNIRITMKTKWPYPVECFARETLMLYRLISIALVVGPSVCTKRH